MPPKRKLDSNKAKEPDTASGDSKVPAKNTKARGRSVDRQMTVSKYGTSSRVLRSQSVLPKDTTTKGLNQQRVKPVSRNPNLKRKANGKENEEYDSSRPGKEPKKGDISNGEKGNPGVVNKREQVSPKAAHPVQPGPSENGIEQSENDSEKLGELRTEPVSRTRGKGTKNKERPEPSCVSHEHDDEKKEENGKKLNSEQLSRVTKTRGKGFKKNRGIDTEGETVQSENVDCGDIQPEQAKLPAKADRKGTKNKENVKLEPSEPETAPNEPSCSDHNEDKSKGEKKQKNEFSSEQLTRVTKTRGKGVKKNREIDTVSLQEEKGTFRFENANTGHHGDIKLEHPEPAVKDRGKGTENKKHAKLELHEPENGSNEPSCSKRNDDEPKEGERRNEFSSEPLTRVTKTRGKGFKKNREIDTVPEERETFQVVSVVTDYDCDILLEHPELVVKDSGKATENKERAKWEPLEPENEYDERKEKTKRTEFSNEPLTRGKRFKKNQEIHAAPEVADEVNGDAGTAAPSEDAVKKRGRKGKPNANKTETEPEEKKVKVDEEPENFECEKDNKKGEKWNLKISTWNVAGLRACVKKNWSDYVLKEDADIICFQETKCPENKLPPEAKVEGYHAYWCSGEKDGYAGVALFSKEKPLNVTYGIGNKEHDAEGRVITAEYEKFYLVTTYVPNSGQGLKTLPKRMEWDELFLQYLKKLDSQKPVVLCGDLNVAHEEIDLKNPKTNQKSAGFTKEERANMTKMLGEGFVDGFRHFYPDLTGAYTFWSYLGNARSRNTGWRLDYFILSERLMDSVCDVAIRSKVLGSDHCPVTMFIHI